MNCYDQEKLNLVKVWIKLVQSKKQKILNVMGYAKQVYNSTEEMDSWDELQAEIDIAKEQLMGEKVKTCVYDDPVSDEIKRKSIRRHKIISSIPKDEYLKLRAKVLKEIKIDPDMKYLMGNFDPNKGFGKAIVINKICEAYEHETRT